METNGDPRSDVTINKNSLEHHWNTAKIAPGGVTTHTHTDLSAWTSILVTLRIKRFWVGIEVAEFDPYAILGTFHGRPGKRASMDES